MRNLIKKHILILMFAVVILINVFGYIVGYYLGIVLLNAPENVVRLSIMAITIILSCYVGVFFGNLKNKL